MTACCSCDSFGIFGTTSQAYLAVSKFPQEQLTHMIQEIKKYMFTKNIDRVDQFHLKLLTESENAIHATLLTKGVIYYISIYEFLKRKESNSIKSCQELDNVYRFAILCLNIVKRIFDPKIIDQKLAIDAIDEKILQILKNIEENNVVMKS